MIKLNLGCGRDIKEEYINIDFKSAKGVNMILDLNKNVLPFEDNSVDEILCSHVLEHLVDPYSFMEECHRVLKEGGIICVKLPGNCNCLEHKQTFHTKGYLDCMINKRNDVDLQHNSNFDLIYRKANRKDIKKIFYRLYQFVSALFVEEYIFEMKKTKSRRI